MADQVKLDPLGRQVLEHLKKHRPKMAQQLEKEGTLLEVCLGLENLAKESLAEGIQKGLDYQTAWEQARSLCFLPDEEDVPSLPNNPLHPTTTE